MPPLVHLPVIDGVRSIWYIERQLTWVGGTKSKSDREEQRRKRVFIGSTSNRIKDASDDYNSREH